MIVYQPGKLVADLGNSIAYVLPDAQSLLTTQYNKDGIPESTLIDWVLKEVYPSCSNKGFVDIGANVGNWTFPFANTGASVTSFEPNDIAYPCLRAGIALNRFENVTTWQVALSDEFSTSTLKIQDPMGTGSSLLDLPTNENPNGHQVVQVRTLDSFNLKGIGLIKIDVEGNEYRVLKGSAATLEENNWPKIHFECWCAYWHAKEREKIFEFLKQRGYKIVKVAGYTQEYIAERDRPSIKPQEDKYGITLVSSLFNLSKYDGKPRERSVQQYLEWGQKVLDLKYPLVVFTDQEFAPIITQEREKRGLGSVTKVIPLSLTDLPYYDSWKGFTDKAIFPVDLNKEKDTASHMILGWHKPSMMASVAKTNPFGSTHIGFIDFGIAHAGVFESPDYEYAFSKLPKTLRVHQVKAFNPVWATQDTYFTNIHTPFAFGYVVGTLEQVQLLEEEYNKQVNQMLRKGRATVDEDVLALAYNQLAEKNEWEKRKGTFREVLWSSAPIVPCRTS